MNILITGSCGFIGFHLSKYLLKKKINVIGVDNLNNYYDINLKKERNRILKKFKNYTFNKVDIKNKKNLKKIFKKKKIDCLINLAAQAGVRYSLINPKAYIDSNIIGFFNLMECSREFKIKKVIYASTSSVYGLQKKFPIKEKTITDFPIQLYAATKKSNEVMAHAYSHLFDISTIGLRFFTVYGPWGRPDMALFKFTKNILLGKPIDVFNNGNHVRDFTYVDDIVESIFKIVIKKEKKKLYKIYNIGNGKKIKLLKYINLIEKYLDRKSIKRYLPLQKGDVVKTHCNNNLLNKDYKFRPKTNVETGVRKFLQWYLSYYRITKK